MYRIDGRNLEKPGEKTFFSGPLISGVNIALEGVHTLTFTLTQTLPHD